MSGKKAGKQETTMSIHAHIKELRTRLFVLALIFIVASGVAYVFREDIAHVLMAPLDGQKLYNLTPGGQFSFILKIIMWAGIAATIPFFIASLYSFIAPALPERARRHGPKILFFSMILLCAGAVFGYIYAIPGAMRFLLSFADGLVTPMITGESYLNFVLAYTVGLGVLFQIPLLMIIINWATPLKPKMLLSMERYVIVIAFVAAAIITPTPDPTNQAIIAAPVIAMYQVGFAAVLVSHTSMRRQARRAQKSGVKTTSFNTQAAPLLATFTAEEASPAVSSTVRSALHKKPAAATLPQGAARPLGDIRPNPQKMHTTARSRPATLPVVSQRRAAPAARPARPGRYLDGVSVSYRSSQQVGAS